MKYMKITLVFTKSMYLLRKKNDLNRNMVPALYDLMFYFTTYKNYVFSNVNKLMSVFYA